MTQYGKSVTQKLVYEIAAQGITIVSGFMYGVDMTAHQAALTAGGKTIAVLAYGLERRPPDYLSEIYEEILHSGLFVSELGGDEPPKKWSFPKRNRIIAGLSQAVLVVEASLKSGSLITANYAKEYGRKIYSVPGPLDSHNSQGTLQLIEEGNEMLLEAQQILEFYGFDAFNAGDESSADEGLDSNGAGEIITFLRQNPATLEEIVDNVDAAVPEINRQLTKLMLAGQVLEEEGRFRARYR
jgi:DNA processing protein